MILNNVLCCLLQYFLYSLISNVRSLKNLSWTAQKSRKQTTRAVQRVKMSSYQHQIPLHLLLRTLAIQQL